MLTGYIRGQELRISTPEIAADSIKYLEAEFHFAGRDWDGYVKTAYFINGTSKFALALADDRITADMGLNLTAGEWEVKLSGVKGGSRITTTTEHIFVREFGSTDGTLPDVTATQAEQIQAQIGNLSNLTTEDKTNLVAAINEAAKCGGGSGGGKDGTGIASITYKGKDEDGGNVYTVLLTDGTSYEITAPKGAAGADGKDGANGKDGSPGKDGTDGTSVTVASVTESVEDGGDNVITFSDGTSVTVKNGSKGSTGAKGDKGDTGSPGSDGTTPYIGDNGNWFIGSTDTGKPSRGAAGAPGAKGDKGATGPQGPAGAPGKDGAGMDITGATVGQIAKITAVDASGVPTAWSPVDMPTGGGGETWEKLYDGTIQIQQETMAIEVDMPRHDSAKEFQIYLHFAKNVAQEWDAAKVIRVKVNGAEFGYFVFADKLVSDFYIFAKRKFDSVGQTEFTTSSVSPRFNRLTMYVQLPEGSGYTQKNDGKISISFVSPYAGSVEMLVYGRY